MRQFFLNCKSHFITLNSILIDKEFERTYLVEELKKMKDIRSLLET